MSENYQGKRPRELGISFGVLPTGKNNAITDVKGVKVGQVTLIDDKKGMRTGVTAIVPHENNIFQHKVPAGIFLGNAFGKATHLYKPKGSADYEHSSGYLRGTFLKVIHDFQEGECPLIRCPTLLIWGRKDRDTPPYMARRMRRLIHGSRLVWIRDGGHFSYLDESTRVALLIKEFLAE